MGVRSLRLNGLAGLIVLACFLAPFARAGDLTCPDGAVQELGQLHCQAADPNDPNSGCNAEPNRFQDIACGTIVCGRSSRSAGQRDADWYRFQVSQRLAVTCSVTAEFPVQLNLLRLNGPPPGVCPPAHVIEGLNAQAGTPASLTRVLQPGSYAAFVAHQASGSLACGPESDYVFQVSCAAPIDGVCCMLDGTCIGASNDAECAHLHGFFQGAGSDCLTASCCTVECPPGTIYEDEFLDCIHVPTAECQISELPVVGCGDVICATGGAFGPNGAMLRDSDLYRLALTQETEVTWRVTPQFPASMYRVQVTALCEAGGVIAVESREPVMPCTTGELVMCLPAGDAFLFVSTGAITGSEDRFDPMLSPCGATYRMELHCDSCFDCGTALPGDSNGDGLRNNFDIDPFVAALVNPLCAVDSLCLCRNDVNGDGLVNNFDVDPFIACLTFGCP